MKSEVIPGPVQYVRYCILHEALIRFHLRALHTHLTTICMLPHPQELLESYAQCGTKTVPLEATESQLVCPSFIHVFIEPLLERSKVDLWSH